MGWIIFAAVLIVVTVTVLIVVRSIQNALRSVSRSLFGTESIKRGLDQQADLLAATPKSVSSMTKIYLPRIQADFPQFNWIEVRQLAESTLLAGLSAISEQNFDLVAPTSPDIRKQVESAIQADIAANRHSVYQRAKVHCTEIASYVKQRGTCAVVMQSAVEYIGYTKENGVIVDGTDERLKQTKYNIEYTYIQDANLVAQHSGDGAMTGIKCPSCGAPVEDLGDKVCAYCGSQVREVNMHAWSFVKFYEVPANIV